MKDDSFDCTLIAHLRIFLLFYRLLYCLILPENRLFFGIWKVVEIEDEHLLRQINATLKKTFGLWVYKPEKEENVRCLCTKCLNDYIHNPDYIVRRLDPFAKVKDHCDKCNQSGWDYVVTKRNYKK